MAADAETDAIYLRLVEELNALGLVYVHVVDHSSMGAPEVSPELKAQIRDDVPGCVHPLRAATTATAPRPTSRRQGRPRRLRPAVHREPRPRRQARDRRRARRPGLQHVLHPRRGGLHGLLTSRGPRNELGLPGQGRTDVFDLAHQRLETADSVEERNDDAEKRALRSWNREPPSGRGLRRDGSPPYGHGETAPGVPQLASRGASGPRTVRTR